MKKLTVELPKVMVGLLYCTCLIIPLALLAQQQEISISTASDEAKKLLVEGRNRFELIEFAASVQYFNQAIEKDPNFALAYLYLSRTGIGDAEKRQQYLAKAVALGDKISPGEKLFILYYKAQVDGEGTKQKEYLDKLLELFPSDKRVQRLAGEYFNFRAIDLDKALKYYQRAIELDKTFAPVYNSIGYLHLRQDNYKEAEQAFVEQIKLMPDRPNPYDSYAELLNRMGRYDESIEQYKKAFDKDTLFTRALPGVGDNYLIKGEYDNAREYYQRQYDRTSDPGEKFGALNRIANSFIQEGKIDAALEVYKRYRALAKDHNRVANIILSYAYEGFVLTESGNTAEGLRHYQKAAEVVNASDTLETIKNNYGVLSQFWECYALLANNETEAALTKMKELDLIVEKKQDSNDLRLMSFLKGMVESNKGNFTKALEHYESSWPDDPLTKYYVAVTYEQMGQKDKANQLYQELEDLKQNNLNLALVKYNINKMTAR